MPLSDRIGFGSGLRRLTQPIQHDLGLSERSLLEDDGLRIVTTNHACGAALLRLVHLPRLGQELKRHPRQLRHPTTNKDALWVLILRLLRWRVDAKGIDRSRSTLHLHLTPMDTRLKIEKLPSQMKACRTPMQPEVIRREAHQHRPHPKVNPSRCTQAAHAGINHRVTGSTRRPGLQTSFGFVVESATVARA